MDRFPHPISFYERPVALVARELVGSHLVSTLGPQVIGRIVETEAYGMDEEAFYGRHVRPTSTGEITTSPTGAVLRGPRGAAFIYSVFFGNWLLNVVAGPPGYLGCILIRAAEPIDGIDEMRRRRGVDCATANVLSGPGRLTKAFAVDGELNGHALQRDPLMICPASSEQSPSVVAGPRVGLKRAIDVPWRFVDPESRSLSRPAPRIADRYGNP